MGATRGKDFKLYYGKTIPPAAYPPLNTDLVELLDCRDVTRNNEKALADASIRGSKYRMQVGTLNEFSLDFQMVYDNADPGFKFLQDAYDNNSSIYILDVDGDVLTTDTGATALLTGLQLMGQVTKFSVAEALEDVGLIDCTIVPAYDSVNLPGRVTSQQPNGAITPIP